MRSIHPRRLLAVGAIGAAALLAPVASAGASSVSPKAVTPHLSGAQCAANKALGTITFVSPFAFSSAPGVLEEFAAQKLGYYSDECLNVSINASSYTPNELVSAGTAQFTSEGSAADTIEAIAGGANLVGLATYADASTYVLLAKANIKNLKQLDGKTVAYHTQLPVVLQEMLAKAGVKGYKPVEDNSYDPTLLVNKNDFQAMQAYYMNEPLTLQSDGLKFSEFYPSHYGVEGTFDPIAGNATWVKEHPQATADFLRASIKAFDYCAVHASICIGIEAAESNAAGQTYDTSHNMKEWAVSVNLVKKYSLPGKGVGVQTTAEWAPEASALRKFGIVKKMPSLASMENTKLIASIYDGSKLIWPGS